MAVKVWWAMPAEARNVGRTKFQFCGGRTIKMYLRRLTMVAAAAFALGFLPLEATVSNGSVTPSSVTFTSSNPSGSVTGTPSTTTVSFKTTLSPSAFTVHVKAVGSGFTGCNTPPASAQL
jgi:hypothetical protein